MTLIRFHKTTRCGSEDKLLSDANFKLLRAVGKLDPAKGSAFTFLSCLIQNALHSAVSKARKVASRYVELDVDNIIEGFAEQPDMWGERVLSISSFHFRAPALILVSTNTAMASLRTIVCSFSSQ